MHQFSLKGKVILITGVSGHIGSALLKYLHEAGAKVWGLDSKGLSSEFIKYCFGFTKVDLENVKKLESALDRIANEIGCIHGLIHAAGFVGSTDLSGWIGDLSDQSRDTFDRALSVNLSSAFTIVKHLKNNFRFPSLIFISSIYGRSAPDFNLYEGTSMDNPAAYGASKAALQQFSKYLASRHGIDGWRSNSIILGGVFRHQPESFVERYIKKTPLGRMATEDDLSGVVHFLLSDASSYITGAELPVDGGFCIL